MMIWVIEKETKNQKQVEALANKLLPGFNVKSGRGYWKGQPEQALTITFSTAEKEPLDVTFRQIKQLAEAIKQINEQECVLVQVSGANQMFFCRQLPSYHDLMHLTAIAEEAAATGAGNGK